jgi:L-serine kinase (ADP)
VKVVTIDPNKLRHIEGFSARRVEWLRAKVVADGRWNKPIALDNKHNLVLDGQHRLEVALALGLKRVPAVKFSYADVEVWSLRPTYSFTWKDVVARAMAGQIYPYKTVKHRFPSAVPSCDFSLEELAE